MKLSPRILALISVVALLSSVLIVPALAAPIDYNDYVYKVEVDGDNELVYVKIPADFARVRVFRTSDNVRIYDGLGAHHDIPFESEVEYRVYLDVFGAREVYSNALDLSYIPIGTQIASGFGFEETGDWGAMSSPVAHVSYYYFETGNPEPLSVITNNTDQISSWDWFYDVHIVENVADANLLTIDYFLEPVYFMYEPWTGLFVQDTTLVFSISSLLRQQQATGKTNALLKEVEAQLAEQGKTLDDIKQSQDETNDKLDNIINGEISGKPPAGSDIVDDYESAEDQLMDSVGGGSDAFQDMTLSAWDKIYAYSQSFLAFGVLFEMYSDIPFFQGLLYIALSLGTFAFLVNLSAMAGRALTRQTAKRGGK